MRRSSLQSCGISALGFIFLCCCSAALGAQTHGPADAAALSTDSGASELTITFLKRFLAKDPGLPALMTTEMAAALPAPKLAQIVDQLSGGYGAFSAFGQVTIIRDKGYTVAIVPGAYERMQVDFRVAWDGQGRVAGFFVQNPRLPAAGWKAPAYAKAGSAREEDTVVDAGGWSLPGTLTLPVAATVLAGSRLPLVILIHGSGPNDRDETVGPRKPFKDIALGLAAEGVASLRYDKRTLVHAQRCAAQAENLGIMQEVVEDALAAMELAAKDARIDAKRIYLAGHSLGAMLAPLIAKEAQARGLTVPAGLILLAAPASPLEDLVLYQVTYLADLDKKRSPEETAAISGLEKSVGLVKGPLPENTQASSLPLGLPAAYWRSLSGYDPVLTARSAGLPLLVVHGSRDYQVPESEADLWERGLRGYKAARLVRVKGMDHLLAIGKGLSSPEDYTKPGSVSDEVLHEVLRFVGGRSSP